MTDQLLLLPVSRRDIHQIKYSVYVQSFCLKHGFCHLMSFLFLWVCSCLVCCNYKWWNIQIDSWDWHVIGWEYVFAGLQYYRSTPWSLLNRLWLQLIPKAQDGSVHMWDILTSQEEVETCLPSLNTVCVCLTYKSTDISREHTHRDTQTHTHTHTHTDQGWLNTAIHSNM